MTWLGRGSEKRLAATRRKEASRKTEKLLFSQKTRGGATPNPRRARNSSFRIRGRTSRRRAEEAFDRTREKVPYDFSTRSPALPRSPARRSHREELTRRAEHPTNLL